jgi:colicin import membrane protein
VAGKKVLILWVALGVMGPGIGLTAARAQEAAQAEDWAQVRSEARALRKKAKQMRVEAQKELKAAETACWKTTFVSGCQADAKDVQRKVERAAQQVDLEALALERRVEAHQRAEKQAKKAEKASKEAEKTEKRAARIRQQEEDRQRKLEQEEAREKKRQAQAQKRREKEERLLRQLK